MRSRQQRSVMRNCIHLLEPAEINCFGGGASLEACSSNNFTVSDFNQTNKSWSFPLRVRGLGRGFNPSSLMTQSLTQDPINPSPENLSFAPQCVAQLDFLPSPTRGEGNASLAINNQTNLTPSLGGGAGERVLLTWRFSC